MRLTCPNCDAQYEVPDEVIPPEGRDVQCSNCGNTWYFAHPDHPELAAQRAEAAPDWPEDGADDGAYDDTADDNGNGAGAAARPATSAPTSQALREPARGRAEAGTAPETVTDDGADGADAPGSGDFGDAAGGADLPPEPGRKTLDPSVSDILREEAEREARLRAAEAGSLESQGELGLDAAPSDDELSRRAREARERMARIRGEEPAPGASLDPGTRRGLLPDIDEINSTLRGGGETGPAAKVPGPPITPTPAPQPRRRSGFARGMAVALILGIVLLMTYLHAPRIAQTVPQADPMLSAYVALVDQARLWLDAQAAAYLPQPPAQ